MRTPPTEVCSRHRPAGRVGLAPPSSLNGDGIVDVTDLELFNAAWQQADVNGDGIVDGDDLD